MTKATPAEQLKELLFRIAVALINNQEKMSINAIEGETSVILELKVATDDIGKILGRSGEVIEAIRKILTAVATKLKRKVLLQIME